ncbi:hypothetical protein ACIRL0_00590 [Streptomyces sp. NPDC102365]|uniref:hypothetical protein n=1 Tax=Streptomyces sp. NPDC102365 TaxID=3366162 RepID=UPI0038298900
MVIQQDLEVAEAAVVEAEDELTRAERHYAVVRSEQAGALLYFAKHRADAARDTARGLRARWEAEAAAREARTAAEEAYRPKAKAAVANLSSARDTAAQAVTEAQAAVARLLGAVAVYDAAVRGAAGELLAAGLTAAGGEELGGTTAGYAQVGGERWCPASGPDLLAAVMQAAVTEFEPRHPLARLRVSGSLVASAGRDQLLKAAVR